MKDEIFNAPGVGKTPFEFNSRVVAVFDDMVSRSVPFYRDVLAMTAELAREFYQPQTKIYDLGCSTGALLDAIVKKFENTRFIYHGVDNSPEMLKKAREKYSALNECHHLEWQCADIVQVDFEPASVFVSNYTFQFLKPLMRKTLLQKIFNALTQGGALLLSEKCLEDSADVSRIFADRYHAMKEANGYSKLEIAEKRDALENVLIPFRVSENIDMLREAGFTPVSIFFKAYNFVSFLALKA
ncbi:MAG TPA: carboxy-S-adenosyl-L-methionine synthase CmoA [Turneriella sp.]|nr:carboxy-S-adenosyl-L-methionine synthase CmoA [Turneriella sp.]